MSESRRNRADSRSQSDTPSRFKAGIAQARSTRIRRRFSPVFITIRYVGRSPSPRVVRVRGARDTPEFSAWRLEDESLPKFACAPGSEDIPAGGNG